MKNVPLENLLEVLSTAKKAEATTFLSVIRSKFLAWLLETDTGIILRRFAAIAAFLFLAGGSYFFQDVPSLLAAAARWHGFFLARVWMAAALVTWHGWILSAIVGLGRKAFAPWLPAPELGIVDQYPDFFHKSVRKGEMIAYLIKHGHLNLLKYCAAHPATRKNDLHEVVKWMFDKGVMVKGPYSNSNVLSPNFDRESVKRMLELAGHIHEIQKPNDAIEIRRGPSPTPAPDAVAATP